MSSIIVNTERPFIPPVQSVTGTSSVQITSVVTHVSRSQYRTGTSSGQVSGPLTQPAMNQPSDVPSVMPLVQPTSQDTSHDVNSATDSPDVQFTRTVGQPISSKMSLPPVSLTDAAAHLQNLDSYVECYSEPTSLLSPWRKRMRYLTGSLPNLSKIWTRKSVKNTYRETIRGVRSFMDQRNRY